MILSIKDLKVEFESLKNKGKKIGLITGCFDILHIGHIQFFRSSKIKTDILVVGLESDASIKISKGENRPINSLDIRLNQVDELKSIDYVFPVNDVYDFKSLDAIKVHRKLLKYLNPNFLFTVKDADSFWKRKLSIVEELGIELVGVDVIENISTSKVAIKLIDSE